jgi:sugar lactone lactonase YvrE
MQTLSCPDVFIASRAAVGEGPVVDSEHGELVWVDIPRGLMRRDPLPGTGNGAGPVTVDVGMTLGAAGLRAGSGYVVAVAEGFGFLDADGHLDVVHPILPDPQLRMNDAKCDPAGRYWAGSATLDFQPGQGSLHCWDPDDGVRTAASGLTLPNGLGWSPDERTFYLADSVRRVVLTAAYDRDSGALGSLREIVSCAPADGMPDGLCTDDDGCLWIAMWGGAEVRRYSPSGDHLATVPMPVSQPSSCAFGPDGTLYITSAADGTNAAAQPLAGSVFALPTAYRGAAVRAFAG